MIRKTEMLLKNTIALEVRSKQMWCQHYRQIRIMMVNWNTHVISHGHIQLLEIHHNPVDKQFTRITTEFIISLMTNESNLS